MGYLGLQAREPTPEQPGRKQGQAQDVAKKHQYLVGYLVSEKTDPNTHCSKEKLAADEQGDAQRHTFPGSSKSQLDRPSLQ